MQECHRGKHHQNSLAEKDLPDTHVMFKYVSFFPDFTLNLVTCAAI